MVSPRICLANRQWVCGRRRGKPAESMLNCVVNFMIDFIPSFNYLLQVMLLFSIPWGTAAVLKLTGVLLTGAFGTLGLLTEFKDKDHKTITRWGKIALVGILLSTLLTFATQIIESHDAQEEAARRVETANTLVNGLQTQLEEIKELRTNLSEELDVSRNVLRGVNQSANPLTDIRVGYVLSIPSSDPVFSDYLKRLTSAVRQMKGGMSSPPGLSVIQWGPQTNKPSRVSFSYCSTFFMPNPKTEPVPSGLVRANLLFAFFKQTHQTGSSDQAKPDIAWYLHEPNPGQCGSLMLTFDLTTQQLTMRATDLPSNPHTWSVNTNRLSSVPDLSLARLDISVSPQWPPDPKNRDLATRLAREMKPECVFLKISTRDLHLKSPKKIDPPNPKQATLTLYRFQFPKQVDDLQFRPPLWGDPKLRTDVCLQ